MSAFITQNKTELFLKLFLKHMTCRMLHIPLKPPAMQTILAGLGGIYSGELRIELYSHIHLILQL